MTVFEVRFIVVLLVALAIFLLALSKSLMVEEQEVDVDWTVPTQASRKTRKQREV